MLKSRYRFWISAFAGMTLMLGAAGCAPPRSHPGLFIVAKPADAVKLDPADITDSQSALVTANIFDTLVEYKGETTHVVPALASSYESSESGRVWTFHLKRGVRFHDNTPLNADAVVFNFKREMEPQNPYHAFGKFAYWNTIWGGYPGKILNVVALNPYTVRFVLKEPVAPFLANLAMFSFAIQSPSAIRKWGADYFKHPVGTGPFSLVLWEPRQRIVLQANPDYWKGKPKINTLIFQPVADNTSRFLQLENGMVDFITSPNPEDLKELHQNQSVTVLKAPGMNIAYLAMNCQKSPFSIKKVRQAVRMAINKRKIIDELYEGSAQCAIAPMPPMLLGYAKNLKDYRYNPEKAKALLRESGYPHGFQTSLWYPPISRDYLPQPKAVAEAIQSDLASVGIHAKLITFDWGTYLDKVGNGEHAMALLGWVGDNGDPDNFLYALLDKDNAKKPAQNIAFYTNETVHRLLVQAQSIQVPSQRAKLYEEAQWIIHDDSPWVPLAYADQIVAFKKGITGIKLNPTGLIYFRNAAIHH